MLAASIVAYNIAIARQKRPPELYINKKLRVDKRPNLAFKSLSKLV